MYVAVKGGEKAIDNAHRWREVRRGDQAVSDLALDQIAEQLQLSVARVMAEGSLFDPELAALAIKQARGDAVEATFLIRAFRTTLPRFGGTRPIDTGAMLCARRISATFKDIPGGQVLGPTFDYTHRLLDFDLFEQEIPEPATRTEADDVPKPHVLGLLGRDGLMQHEALGEDDAEIPDLTRTPLSFPAERSLRLQALARGDEGFLLGLGYSTQRGYARNHAFVGELRVGIVEVEMEIPELGFAITVGEIEVTECETVNQFQGSKSVPAQFTRGYGLVFGQQERKAIAMALVDRALRWRDSVRSMSARLHRTRSRAVALRQHPGDRLRRAYQAATYVDFQSELELIRRIRAEAGKTADRTMRQQNDRA